MGSNLREGFDEGDELEQDGQKEVGVGDVGKGQELSQEEDSKVDGDDDNGVGDAILLEQLPVVPNRRQQQQQQQPHVGPSVRWERFLPVRSLKVLLVENDDCTREVVSALLRNCSYEVTAAENGLQAWQILEDLTNRVDLVLTEVVMPGLSGIGLLCKIMNHKTCKNIPVIMMSSIDSMGIVFKCLSKGAVDFLIKPVRKNELKNLWQHVWRRCHSSGSSGSESGIQHQKSAKSKSADDSENNAGSYDKDEYGSTGMNARDGSDNGSGTQSSWTKHAVEMESPQPVSPSDQLADGQDSTCAQVIYPKTELLYNQCAPVTTMDFPEKTGLAENIFMGEDLELGVAGSRDFEHIPCPNEKNMDKLPNSVANRGIDCSVIEVHSGKVLGEPTTHAVDLIDGTANGTEAQVQKKVIAECKDKTIEDCKELPSLELSLRRLRSNGEGQTAIIDDHSVFRCSDLSAFSRYNSSAASNQGPMVHGGSSSIPLDSCSEAVKMESTQNMISNSNIAALKQGSNASSDNNDLGSTTKNTFTKPAAIKEKTPPTSTGITRGAQHQLREQQNHHSYHHHQHHVHIMQQQQLLLLQTLADPENMTFKTVAVAAPPCGSSNIFSGPVEGNPANYSLNGSNSGSNHGSNGQNGSSTAVDAGVMNEDKDNRDQDVGKTETEGGASGVGQNRTAQREAALNKFRQKRKERNFEKKVRYQSRKKLAEQRPRVRGQFVRQMYHERSTENHDNL